MAGRRKKESEHIRSLVRTSGGKSYSVTIPVDIIRKFGWGKRQKLELSADSKKHRITISDWPRKK